ncbi:hypothetical protein APHAL10511_003973 [Amanita phalloides]|nr:hypothetical protein APHAL10511_003973 [Amanita phalloides]
MAQAVFDDHPLRHYLRGAGEIDELMPGSSSNLEMEIDPVDEDDVLLDAPSEWQPRLLIGLLDVLYAVFELVQPSKMPNHFVERFKYDIISSSLLSPTLQTPHHRPVRTPPIPGRLKLHSRDSSVDAPSAPPPPNLIAPQEPSYITPSLLVVAVAFFYLTGHTLLVLIFSAAVALLLHSLYVMNDSSKIDMTPCLTSLNELIAASDAWASIIQDAIANIEVEEHSLLYGVTFPSPSPTSSIRVALHSSLLTTQNQCDNVRQLFSALTSATELSQLSEMYAPTPSKSGQSSDANSRPLSLPTSQSQRQLSDSKMNKRSTWNGSYTTLASQVGPLPPFLRRREKRCSDVSSILQVPPVQKSRSAPVTPANNSPSGSVSHKLDSVREETGEAMGPGAESFGVAALAFHRSLKAEAADVFGSSSPDPSSSRRRSWMPLTTSHASRMSSIKNGRHLLSLATLHSAIQSALASKRYACAHLLALRFLEDEDEGYWEDIRSVMALLTTTFSDATSRLMQALEEAEPSKPQDRSPTLPDLDDGSQYLGRNSATATSSPRRMPDLTSFAPIPSPFARFAAHVAAISSSLEEAKEHLDSCVSSLKEDQFNLSSPWTRTTNQNMDTTDLHPALQAYDRLRRELGLTLRECERGRERLLEIVKPPADPTTHDSDSEDMPHLAHDISDESDKPGPRSLSDGEEGDDAASLAALVESKIEDDGGDDATEHLLLSASAGHLPPAIGIEQVFEADTLFTAGFTRARSKLTREERIKLAKARRANAVTSRHRDSWELDGNNEGSEKWGPGGEVVQELKDVVWKVGERRRKFADELQRQSVDLAGVVSIGDDREVVPICVDGDARVSLVETINGN